MNKKLFVIASVSTLLFTACGNQSPTPAAVPTSSAAPVVATTEVPAATVATDVSVAVSTEVATTETSATLPTETATVGTPAPTNPPDCTNSASFVTDVTIPDNSNMTGGATFTKTWRISNTGTCVWGPGYTLTHYSDERMGAPDSVSLGITPGGQTADISVDLVASNSVGTHRGNFVIKNPAGLIMQIDDDSRLWVIINVTSTVTATASATATITQTTANGSVTSTTIAANTAASDSAFATVTCSFSTDPAKLTAVINAVNAYRQRNDLPAYTANTQLARAAQAHANDMACNSLFGHTGSNKSTPQKRVAASGYEASSMSENVYGSYPPLSGQEVVNWWINDKTDLRHNLNMLSSNYTEIGAGYSFFNNFGYYVLVFAKP
jgi:uncharacterized protein YkwD